MNLSLCQDPQIPVSERYNRLRRLLWNLVRGK